MGIAEELQAEPKNGCFVSELGKRELFSYQKKLVQALQKQDRRIRTHFR
jgi:hypothetical protein